MRRLRGAAGERDAGTTLVEMLVATVLTGLLVTLVATIFVSSLKTVNFTRGKVVQAQDTALAADVMSRRIRVAIDPTTTVVAFTSATGSSMSFYAALQNGSTADPNPTKVTYAWNASRGCLLETLVTPSPVTGGTWPFGYPAVNTTTRCLAYGTQDPGTQLFTYYSSGTGTTQVTNVAGTVPSASLGDIESVGIALSLQTAQKSAGATDVTTRVTLTNYGLTE